MCKQDKKDCMPNSGKETCLDILEYSTDIGNTEEEIKEIQGIPKQWMRL